MTLALLSFLSAVALARSSPAPAAAEWFNVAVGFTHSAVSVGDRLVLHHEPSLVGYLSDRVLLGGDVLAHLFDSMSLSPQDTVSGLMRVVGLLPSDELIARLKHERLLAYELRASPANASQLVIDLFLNGKPRRVRPEDVLADLLRHLKRLAAGYTGSRVVTALPDRFDDMQRRAVREAFHLAALDLVAVEHESVAIAAAFCSDRPFVRPEMLLVLRFGGGALDAALVHRTAQSAFDVQSAASSEELGGDMIDRMVASALTGFPKTSLSLRILRFAERAKRELEDEDIGCIELGDNIIEMTADKFNEICGDVFARVLELADQVASSADVVLLAGSAFKPPKLREMVRAKYGAERVLTLDHLDSSAIVALGLSVLHPTGGAAAASAATDDASTPVASSEAAAAAHDETEL
jgi:molecular chaperone DnaK (HSP70)